MTEPISVPSGHADNFASRRYFRKFEAIMAHMTRVAGVMESEGRLSRDEVKILTRYALQLTFTFRALSLKYLFAGRGRGRFGKLDINTAYSGFPTAAEIMTMGNDALQADKHLAGAPSDTELKRQMVDVILSERVMPAKLQFALSQQMYYEELIKGDLFWAQNDPQITWVETKRNDRRHFLLHWAVWDSELELPVIYIMDLDDTGRTPLPKDQRRWPEVQAHLMAQSLGTLKLVTIARGFDEDFDDLHPKRLRRFHLGPFYSSAFTKQPGPLSEVLASAVAPVGQDWALVWTEEELESKKVVAERSGWFSTVEREVFALDPFGGRGAETGTTRMQRSVILPQRPYQVLAERDVPGFERVEKYVVSPSGRVLQY